MSNRRDYRWEKLATKFRSYCRTRNALCHLCVARGDIENAQIDYRAPRYDPNGFEADHKKSWSQYPQLRYEWANLAAAHSRCNRQRRDEKMNRPLVNASNPIGAQRVWVKPDW
jgi:5-methylcytosine-specific restriction endonuclease McrA